jgi:hypothetical protein
MNVSKNVRAVFNMATGGLLVAGLFLLPHGTLKVAYADSGALFVSPEGGGTACTPVTPCALSTALDIAEADGEDDVIYLERGVYEGKFAYTLEDAKSLMIRGEPGTTAQDIILDGGGTGTVLYLISSGTVCSVAITGLTIQGGGWSGLDVYCENGSLGITVTGVVIQNNMTYHDGGGIEINAGIDATGQGNGVVTMEVRNSIIRGNQALKRGGGIAASSCYGNSSINLSIVNSLIYENQANWSGGGIDIAACEIDDNNVTRAVVINSTITNNVADAEDAGREKGGGIRVYAYSGTGAIASLDLYNTIVHGNTLGGGGSQDLHVGEWGGEWGRGNATVNAYYSDIGDVSIDSSHGVPTYNPVNVISEDPAFVDPGNDDYHLTASSPCIDAGTTAVPDPPGLPSTDFEGEPRVSGDAPDIGADEFGYWIYLPLVLKNYS